MDESLPLSVTHEVRDRCLCLHVQRAARAAARLFDDALKPVGLTNGQYSLLMALNRPVPARIVDLVPFLAMDRTTLTAALKPLERRGLVEIAADPMDRRTKRLRLTQDGRTVLARAVPIWRDTHDLLDTLIGDVDGDALRRDLRAIGAVRRPPHR